ncbi:coatomer subunit delta [Quercus suber]|uniref:Coatomer subunit delta n=1 Tax=Quercus suber TaxID=58331 RepID=A0AAW0IMJ4_QUESU
MQTTDESIVALTMLVSKQFVDMSRIRIEGLLVAFSKLTENVCYVYQPFEALYLLLVTNKQSNILEDLETLLRMLSKLVPEYSYSLDEGGICKTAFELIFYFDEVISLGHKEIYEEKLHKLVLQRKINETKDVMKHKACEIDERKGGFMSLRSMGSGRIESSFSDMSISGGGCFGSGSGFGLSIDIESFSTKSKGLPSTFTNNCVSKRTWHELGKSQKTNQFLESLKAEGKFILEDVQLKAGQSRSAAPPLTDPITLLLRKNSM